MVKHYTGNYKKTNSQHRRIIKWLEANSHFKNAIVFTEFKIPGKQTRDVDMMILLPDRIHLLELKRHKFTQISMNSWEYLDKDNKVQPYEHRIKDYNETPFQQAEDTSDKIKYWIKRNCHKFTDRRQLKTFIQSNEFKIYPSVYINPHSFLDQDNLEIGGWVYLCIGVENLEEVLSRNYHRFARNFIDFQLDELEEMAFHLRLSDHKPVKKGKLNLTLVQIAAYMYEHDKRWPDVELIRDEVFESGEKRKQEVRDAVRRGRRDKILIMTEEGIAIDPLFEKMIAHFTSVETAYKNWAELNSLIRFHQNNPEIIQLYFTYISDEFPISPSTSQNQPPVRLPDFPASLTVFLLSNFVQPTDTNDPEYFRPGGIQWIDFVHRCYVPFLDEFGHNYVDLIIQDVQYRQSVVIIGSPSSGKTTLLRLVGMTLRDNQEEVILLTHLDFDDQTYSDILAFAQDENYQESSLTVLLENLHLFSSQQLHQLAILLGHTTHVHYIITGRESDTYLKKDIFTLGTKQFDDDVELYYLDDAAEIQLRSRLLIKSYLKSKELELAQADIEQITEDLLKKTGGTPALLRIELDILDDVKDTQQAKYVYRSYGHNRDFGKSLLRYIEKKMDAYLTAFPEEENNLRILFLMNVLFAYLEIPLQQPILHQLTGVANEKINVIYNYWEKLNEFSLNDIVENHIHPTLAEKFIETVIVDDNNWKEIKKAVFKHHNLPPKTHFLDQMLHLIITLEPKLLSNFIQNQKIRSKLAQTFAFSLPDLFSIPIEYNLYELVELLEFFFRYANFWSNDQWATFFQSAIESNLSELVRECPSLYTILELFDLMDHVKSPALFAFLEEFSADFFLNRIPANGQDFDHLIRQLKDWNYSRVYYLEYIYLENYLFKEKMSYRLSQHLISLPTFLTFDHKSGQEIVKKISDSNPYALRSILRFLNEFTSKHNTESELRPKILSYLLQNFPEESSIILFCLALEFLNEADLDGDSLISSTIQQLELPKIQNSLKTWPADWFRYFLDLIQEKQIENLIGMARALSLADMVQIWNNERPDESPYFTIYELLEQLEKIKWCHLPQFLENFGVNYFLDHLDPEKLGEEVRDFSILRLLRFLIEFDWPSKEQFIAHYDFTKWAEAIDLFHYFVYDSKHIPLDFIPNYPEIVQNTFRQIFFKYDSYQLRQFIEFCNSHEFPWKEWIAVEDILDYITEDQYSAERFVKLLESKGWDIPEKVKQAVKTSKIQENEKFLNRLSKMDKANHYYHNGKKHQALTIYENIIQNPETYSDKHNLIQLIMDLEKLEKADQTKLANQIPYTNLINLVESERIRRLRIIDLYKISYNDTNLSHLIAEIYLRQRRGYDKQFWIDLQKTEIPIETLSLRIIQYLWKKEEFQRIVDLPAIFNSQIPSFCESIEDAIFANKIISASIIQLLLKSYRLSNIEEEQQLAKIINNIRENSFAFSEISLLLTYLDQPGKYLSVLLQFNREWWEAQIEQNTVKSILTFFQFFENLDIEWSEVSWITDTIDHLLTRDDLSQDFRQSIEILRQRVQKADDV